MPKDNQSMQWEVYKDLQLNPNAVPEAVKLIIENLTPNGNEQLEHAQSVVIEALGLTQIDQPFGFKYKE